jgi:hypothetical protein
MLYAENDKRININIKSYLKLYRLYSMGELKDKLGYNKLVTDDIELYNDIYNWHHSGSKFIREYNAEDEKGNIYNVRMYLWKDNIIKEWEGLICLVDDVASDELAKIRYNLL